MKISILISITSVPKRLNTTLKQVLTDYNKMGIPIVVPIPKIYMKWGAAVIPDYIQTLANVTIHSCPEDYGPATKLLGALDYLTHTHQQSSFSHILTLDDDILYTQLPDYLMILTKSIQKHPSWVLTPGGITLNRPPFQFQNGLSYKSPLEQGFVDCPQGYLGVSYPVKALLEANVLFTLRKSLPEGVFHDDDAYFGIALASIDTPIYSYRIFQNHLQHTPSLETEYPEACLSAVEEKSNRTRTENESLIFQYAVEQSYLPIALKHHRNFPSA